MVFLCVCVCLCQQCEHIQFLHASENNEADALQTGLNGNGKDVWQKRKGEKQIKLKKTLEMSIGP